MFGVAIASMLLSAAAPLAKPACERPDTSFVEFLRHFKSAVQFRYSRLVLPLRFSQTEPESALSNKLVTRATAMTLVQLQATGRLQIVVDAHASNTGDSETDVCENLQSIRKNQAVFLQYACHSDLYANTYHFIRRNGCWFLRQVDEAGG